MPSLFTSWFTLRLEPPLRGSNLGPRNLEEAKLLTEVTDLLLGGHVLPAIMILIGRLKALAEVASPDSAGWNVARHHQLTRTDDMGLLTQRDRAHAARDSRDEMRLLGYVRGAPLPGGGGQRPHS